MKNMLLPFFCAIAFSAISQNDTLSVYFDFNSAVLNDAELSRLNTLNSSDKRFIALVAHCDTVGSVAFNHRLAERRMNFVVKNVNAITDVTKYIKGEKDAAQDAQYNAAHYRRVDIIYTFDYKPTPPPVQEEPVREPSELVNSLTSFLKDSTSKETTIDLSILFYSNTDKYYPECESELWELFDFLYYNPSITAHISGHVCCADDYDLSSRRAYKVYMFLVERSISRDRLTYRGYSNKKPKIAPELTDEDRRLNRRVDVQFTKSL